MPWKWPKISTEVTDPPRLLSRIQTLLRSYQRCNDRRDCDDGSDEIGCSENVLRRLTQIVEEGESGLLAAVSDAGIGSSTKYELFEAVQMVFQVMLAILTLSVDSIQLDTKLDS